MDARVRSAFDGIPCRVDIAFGGACQPTDDGGVIALPHFGSDACYRVKIIR